MNVKIFQRGKNAMQSGRAGAWSADANARWVLEYETNSARQPEGLMGWTSSGDTLNQVRMSFDTCDDAIAFANENGWSYTVLPVHKRKPKPRNYTDNFKYKPFEE